MKYFYLTIFFFYPVLLLAQLTPEVTSWKINTTGSTGFNNILTNVQSVQYSANWVYVTCTSIPDYSIGPWPGNPNTPVNQNFVFKITRNPLVNPGTPVSTPLGHIGVWSNGVSIFNAKDAFTYNNQGIWHQNAVLVEGPSFDNCLGHPAPNGEYHHHLNPTCLYDDGAETVHAPIIGYAFDGFPIYGAYGFTNTNGTGAIKRMESSYQVRNITSRTTLPDGTTLNISQYGPAVSANYPLGYYIEDYEYVSGSGDLDEHNGRYCITPDYPLGTYAYFVTIDAQLNGVYPYVVGPLYYGTVAPGNTGPNSGHNIISEPVTVYNPSTGTLEINNNYTTLSFYPNPVKRVLNINNNNNYSELNIYLFDISGKELIKLRNVSQQQSIELDLNNYSAGVYYLKIAGENTFLNEKIVVIK